MLKRYDGTNWVDVKAVKRYDGTQWVDCQFVRRWDGSQWVDVWTGKRMAYFHNGDGTSDCSISNGTATINMTVPSNSQGSAGLQSNFDLAVGDEVEISMAFNLGTTGINYRMAVITVGTRNGGHVVNHWDGSVYDSGDDVPVT